VAREGIADDRHKVNPTHALHYCHRLGPVGKVKLGTMPKQAWRQRARRGDDEDTEHGTTRL
jgi:hypothetical protein